MTTNAIDSDNLVEVEATFNITVNSWLDLNNPRDMADLANPRALLLRLQAELMDADAEPDEDGIQVDGMDYDEWVSMDDEDDEDDEDDD